MSKLRVAVERLHELLIDIRKKGEVIDEHTYWAWRVSALDPKGHKYTLVLGKLVKMHVLEKLVVGKHTEALRNKLPPRFFKSKDGTKTKQPLHLYRVRDPERFAVLLSDEDKRLEFYEFDYQPYPTLLTHRTAVAFLKDELASTSDPAGFVRKLIADISPPKRKRSR